jgi:hypothetical protein
VARKGRECKTHKEALRCLKRRISDAIYAALVTDAQQAATAYPEGPGGQPGNLSVSRAAGSQIGLKKPGETFDTKGVSICAPMAI